jgi:RNA-directed DNA polymerase
MIVKRIAQELGLPATYVTSLSRAASYEYKQYPIAKRSGGYRLIQHPSRRLKALQRWLLLNVVEQLPVHNAAMAYRKGKSIFGNAQIHAGSHYLLRMDFQNFFPSITEDDLRTYFAHHAGFFSQWDATDVDCFCGLVCRWRALTIGAPTSPALSNVICHDLDVSLHALAEAQGAIYTRYADDLFFSTKEPNILRTIEQEVVEVVASLTIPAKLQLNRAKTRHSSKKRARHVTGIILGSDGVPHIGRALKRKIRALIYGYSRLDQNTRASLAGMIAYASGFDPEFINSLIAKYGLAKVRIAMKGVAS